MDSEMVMEVPDTPERAAFARSTAESSSSTCGIKDKHSLSKQFFEPMTKTYSRQMKKYDPHDFNGNGTKLVDSDFLFSQARFARLISDTSDNGKHFCKSSAKPEQTGVSNDSGTNLNIIDLSQESSPFSHPTKYRTLRHREEKHLVRQSKRNQMSNYDKLAIVSSESMEDLRKERNYAGNSLKTFVSLSNANEADNINCSNMAVSTGKEKVPAPQMNSLTGNERLQSRDLEFSFPVGNSQQNKLSSGCLLPCDLANSTDNCLAEVYYKEHKNSDNQGASSSYSSSSSYFSSVVKNLDSKIGNGSCEDFQSINTQASYRHFELDLHPKNNGSRRLVRNGCISPSNISRNKTAAKDKGLEGGSAISSKIPNNNSFQSLHRSNFECRIADRGKGKELMNNDFFGSSQCTVVIPQLGRSGKVPQKDMTIISDVDFDNDKILIDGYGEKNKLVGSSSLLSSSNVSCFSESENMPCYLSSSDSENARKGNEDAFQCGQNSTLSQGSLKLNSEAPQSTGKRKISFAHINTFECSSSTVHTPRIPYDRTSLKSSNTRSTRSRKSVRVDTAMAPIVELDELDTTTQEENRVLSDEFIAKTIQLEADEALARQLQEQFYLESPPVGDAEAQREALLPALLERQRFLHSSTRIAARARTDDRIGRIRRNTSRPSMSMEERYDFLEALEAAFESGGMTTDDLFLDIHRDFNENDYEMLLALDENNHRHVGASERQINSLPQSLIKEHNSDSKEACAVCLEVPSMGDIIRHLPCLHKFHKDCIDKWLRRKRSCPICKCGIN